MLYYSKPMKESKYFLYRTSQRAAGGGIAACTIEGNGLLRASRNDLRAMNSQTEVGETE